MSAGEKLVELAADAMRRDHNSGTAVRRALWHGAVGAAILTIALAVCIGTAARKSGIKDAFDGGRMAKQTLPQLTADINEIRLDVQRIAGAVDVLSNRGIIVMNATQEHDRTTNQ